MVVDWFYAELLVRLLLYVFSKAVDFVYQILITDDHPMLREALASSLLDRYVGATLHQADSMQACLSVVQQGVDLDLLLYDLHLGDAQGIAGLQKLRLAVPDVPILVISAEQDKQTILGCLAAGAAGFVLKSQAREAMLHAVELVLEGQIYFTNIEQESVDASVKSNFPQQQLELLTNKQLQVLSLIAEGCVNKEICQRLCIAETTVKTHVSEILRKLEVKNRTQAALGLDKAMLKALLAE